MALEMSVGDDPFDHCLRRPAAVIADAIEAHGVAELGIGALDRDFHLAREVGKVRDIAGLDAESGNFAARHPAPDEDVRGQRHLMLLGAAEDVAVIAVLDEDVGQAGGVAEAVDVVSDGRRDAEAVAEIALAVDELAMQPGGGRQVQVGLDELPARNMPLAALDELPDPREEIGTHALDDLVEPGFAAGEDELRVFVAPVGGRGHRRQRLVGAGLPAPQPHGIDMGVADHVDAHDGSDVAGNGKVHPFTAPAVRAPMIRRCRTRKTTTAGTIERTLAAARICVEVWL